MVNAYAQLLAEVYFAFTFSEGGLVSESLLLRVERAIKRHIQPAQPLAGGLCF